jgi:hypothetical protein
VTALHKDNYENLYIQICGEKKFCLVPPLAYACVAERELRPASYVSHDFLESLFTVARVLRLVYVEGGTELRSGI